MSMTKELSQESFCRMKVMLIPHPHDSQRSEVEKSMLSLETLDYDKHIGADNENKLLVTRSSPRSGQPAKQTMRTVHKSFTEYGICTV